MKTELKNLCDLAPLRPCGQPPRPSGGTHLSARATRKPVKIVVPIADGLKWRGDGGKFIYQEKMDGCFAAQATDDGHLIAGEVLADGNHGRTDKHSSGYYVFDILEFKGENLRPWPLRERLRVLDFVFNSSFANRHSSFHRVPTGSGGEFLEHVLELGGEGIVAKDLDAPWGAPMLAAKRIQDFYCVVTGFCWGKQSVEIGLINRRDAETQSCSGMNGDENLSAPRLSASAVQSAGRVALFGGKIERVRIGSIIKVCGMNLTAPSGGAPFGKIREPRLCNDTPDSWLVKF